MSQNETIQWAMSDTHDRPTRPPTRWLPTYFPKKIIMNELLKGIAARLKCNRSKRDKLVSEWRKR